MSELRSPFDLQHWKIRVDQARAALAEPQGEPTELVAVLDELLRTLGRSAGWDHPGCALVALGGYGRAEMAPHSDVDLLFLIRRNCAVGDIDPVLYPLWDLGLDVGHALRTPADCATLAPRDLTVATALLDARHLLGDEGLFAKARQRVGLRPGGSRETRRWVPKLLADVAARRQRFGEISHLLEPHIKEGSGGLRDLQASRWVLACLGLDPRQALVPGGEGAGVARSLGFLNQCRNALHSVAGRKTDHLTFEFHGEVAARVLPGQPLARFFEQLHRASHCITATWDQVAARAQQELLPRRRRRPPPGPPQAPEPVAAALVQWCREGGEFPEELRLAFATGSSPLLGRAVLAAAARLLRTRAPLAPLLRRLHGLGRLALFAPELDAVAHQVHYDARHAYTTGVHCIEALGAFERLWLGELEREEPHLTRIASAVLHPAATRLAVVCHDLGKAGGSENHEERGALVAHDLALRLGFSASEAVAAEHLTRHHQAITQLAFGEDLEDPASWERARDASGDSGLDALVALAFADLLATNPNHWSGVWSDWKRDLLLHLYARARGGDPSRGPSRAAHLREAVRKSAADQGLGEVTAGWEQIPSREVEQVPPDLLARLLHLGQALGAEPARWHVEHRGLGLVEVTGVVAPLPRVLGSTTAALAALALDVLSFQVHAWADGTTHLWFRLAAPPSKIPDETVASRLTATLIGKAPPGAAPLARLPNRRYEAVPVQTRVHLAEGDHPFHTVLELRCRDRKGLIRDLARCFDQLGLTVEYAMVTTHGPVAQDVFHLKDIFGGRVDGEAKRQALVAGVAEIAQGVP